MIYIYMPLMYMYMYMHIIYILRSMWCRKIKRIRSKPLRCDLGGHQDKDKKRVQNTLFGFPV